MSEITDWLEKFKNNWEEKQPEKVLELFTEDVKYFERPDQVLEKDEIRSEWENIKQQEDIELNTKLFSEDSNRFTVQWNLSYKKNGEKTELNGIYLIVLDDRGLCEEFWQYCQSE